MFDEILQRMRDKISSSQYLMTLHAEEEMSDDNLTIYAIEQIKTNRKKLAVERPVEVASF